VTGGRSTGDEAWHQGTSRAWEIYFAVCAAGVTVFATVTPDHNRVGGPYVVVGVLAVMSAWYLLFGRRIVARPDRGWRGPVFQAVQLGLFVVAVSVASLTTFLLFALCPLVYMTLPTRAAHLVVVGYAFTPAAVTLVTDGPSSLTVTVPVGVIVTAISVAMALTIERIEHISDERAALIVELDSTRAEVARLSREAGIAEERQRLAGDIHDTVAQGLSSVVMLVEAADATLVRDPDTARGHLALAARTARENLDEARAIVAALTPSPLAEATLADALRRLSQRFAGDTGTAATVRVTGDDRPLPTGIEVVLLRVAQEALTNARKHAEASTVDLELAYTSGGVSLEVTDDGGGFDIAALSPGYGLGAMRARVEQVGGRLLITSGPDRGTTVRAEATA
jgi:signal transduction histidine kinase